MRLLVDIKTYKAAELKILRGESFPLENLLRARVASFALHVHDPAYPDAQLLEISAVLVKLLLR